MHYEEITELNADLVHRSTPDLLEINEEFVAGDASRNA